MEALVLILLGLTVTFFYKRKSKKVVEEIPPRWTVILDKKVSFFRALDADGKKRFLHDVAHFLSTINIVGVTVEVTLEDRLLVASSAIIPLFGFPQWHYHHLDEVILYPSAFDRNFNFDRPQELISGMVGSGNMEGKMILSKRALHHGFDNSRDKQNVGIHEFIHLLDKEDGGIDGIPPVFHEQASIIPWMTLIKKKMKDINRSNSDIRDYGATNVKEFLAVSGEYFFERPHLLKRNHPELYDMMSIAFNQTPDTLLAAKEQKVVKLGRNSPCPCGSGLKYKKCCLD